MISVQTGQPQRLGQALKDFGPKNGTNVQVGLLFYMCIFWCTFSMWSTMMVFPLEKNFLAKERAADMYRLSAYFVSSTICDLLAELVHPTMFVPLVYFMAGLKSDISTFIFTLLSVYLIAITAQVSKYVRLRADHLSGVCFRLEQSNPGCRLTEFTAGRSGLRRVFRCTDTEHQEGWNHLSYDHAHLPPRWRLLREGTAPVAARCSSSAFGIF